MNLSNKSLRLLFILEKLSLNKEVCIKYLAKVCNTTVRTIQNDFKILKEYFEDKLIKKSDCYILLQKEHFSNLFKSDPKTTREFLKLVYIVDSNLYNRFINENQDLIKALKFNSSSIYQIENSPYENIQAKHKKIINQLENAILNQEYITIKYAYKHGSILYIHSIPIKILYLNENWYLVVLTTNNIINGSAFKQLRISSIISISPTKIEPKKFDSDNTQKIKAKRFTKNIQTAYSNMDKPLYQVKLNISKEVAKYFKKKKYLKSQKIIKELENRDIVIVYEICDDMEVIPIIQRWIPFVRVIEPLRIQKKVEENILRFMNRE